jgi:hypothetical protein
MPMMRARALLAAASTALVEACTPWIGSETESPSGSSRAIRIRVGTGRRFLRRRSRRRGVRLRQSLEAQGGQRVVISMRISRGRELSLIRRFVGHGQEARGRALGVKFFVLSLMIVCLEA